MKSTAFFLASLTVASIGIQTAGATVKNFFQCGGNGWTGETVCGPGYHCQYFNEWYSQCLPGIVTTTATATTTTTTTSEPTTTTTTTDATTA